MTYLWIETSEQLAQHLGKLPAAAPLYLDTEFMRERTFWPQLALVQLNVDGRIYLIDAPALKGDALLTELLTQHPLVMHGCSEDLEAIRVFTGVLPCEIRDTQVAAALCGASLQLSYQRLVADTFEVELPKDATRTDWLRRPLSIRQLDYARDDVVWLPQLAEGLTERLSDLRRLAWWQEECQAMLDAVPSATPLPDAWKQVKGAGGITGVPLAHLEAVAAWRDREARSRDLPRSFLLKDPVLLALCQSAPTSLAQLEPLGVHPSVVRRDGQTLLALLRDSAANTPPPALPGPPEPEERARVKRLRAAAEEVAQKLDLETDVLVRRRWLESLARNPDQLPSRLTGWRREWVGEALQKVAAE